MEDRIIVIGGSIEGVATDIVEMFNITTQTWSQLRHLPSPATDFALAKVEKTYLDHETITKHFQFSQDVGDFSRIKFLSPSDYKKTKL